MSIARLRSIFTLEVEIEGFHVLRWKIVFAILQECRGCNSVVECPAMAGMQQEMFTVYVLKNSLTGGHYIGCTNNVVRRISENNRGQTKSTNQKGIWEIIYTEEYDNLLEAKRRERLIKSYKGGNAFKKLISRG